MSTDRDVSRIVRSWLEEGVTTLPDRVLDGVLDQVPATPQRPPWWPARRLAQMNTLAKTAIAAAAVLVVAILGYNLLPGSDVGGPAPTPTPIPTASPVPSPTPGVPILRFGTLEPGTYRNTSFTSEPFLVTVPAGWSREDNFISNGDPFETEGVSLATWLVSHVYADSCQWEGTLVEAGSTATLTAALGTQVGHQTSGPTEVTVGGRPATRFEFSVAADFELSACDNEFIRLWPDAGPNENYGLPIFLGQTTTVYVLDFDGAALIVATITNDDSPPADLAELQAVLDSLEFEP